MGLSNQSESVPQVAVLSGTGFSQSHSLLWVQPPALRWGPPQTAGSTINHYGLQVFSLPRHCRLQGRCFGTLPAPPSLLTFMYAQLPQVPLLSKTKEVTQQVFPILSYRLDASTLLLGLALARHTSNLKPRKLLKASYWSHTNIPCSRHKPNT